MDLIKVAIYRNSLDEELIYNLNRHHEIENTTFRSQKSLLKKGLSFLESSCHDRGYNI